MLEPQILATDFGSRFMTGVVAVCLALTSPYAFKIVKSFICWALSSRGWHRTNTSNARSIASSSSPDSADDENLLLGEGTTQHGVAQHSRPGEEPIVQDGYCRENERDSVVEEPINNGQTSDDPALALNEDGEEQSVHAPSGQKDDSIAQATSRDDSPQTDSTVRVSGVSARREAPSADKGKSLLDMLEDSESSREFAWYCVKYVVRGGRKASELSTAMFLIIALLFGVFLAWTMVGVLSAKIASDKTGLSSSQHCGIWQFDDNAGDEASYRDDLNNHQKESQASQYSRNCYNNPDLGDGLLCRIFYNQSIKFDTKIQQPCPFPSPELCFGGLYSAITFDTGYVDASIIGVNYPVTHMFRRRTSCSPLNLSEPYVKRNSPNTDEPSHHYYYGPKDNVNYTFNTSGRPFEWLVPVYSVK